ncbi:restriction endonuclease subunit S [Bacteroides sp. 14(A)]|uniref:restriction endonuclease subunit S n=1 Tax=Bacteroides sp. 14(A) TaxID=1163670 RepID=UPI0004785DA8|nr:restriction endonuclease subunit S [Bacteroides sp. 14(A)]
MKKYDIYKNSGIEWIGEIPEHWRVNTIGRAFNLGRGRVISAVEISENIGEYPVYSSQTENLGIMGKIDSYDFDGEYVTWTTDGANAGTVFYREGKFNCTNVCGTLQQKNTNEVNLKYVPYFLNIGSKYYVRLDINPKLMNNMMAKIPFIIPPKEEQNIIAEYLDYKTSEIDSLINQNEKLISLFQEEKQAVINQAVTKGINPNVELKYSEIDWLGDIPTHWDIKRLRYLGNCQNGISQGADYFGSGYPFVNYGDIYKNIALPETVTGLANSTDSDREIYSVKKGDVFFTRTSETIEEIGFASTCLKTIEDAVFSGFVIRFRPTDDRLVDEFAKYYFKAQVHRKFFVKEMNLVTRASLSQELLKKLPVLLPPKEEQIEIADYLDGYISNINLKIDKTKRIIELLKEYKTALISEVVTGKIKVIE